MIDIIGEVLVMQDVFCIIGWFLCFFISVLINGEFGIGKELVVYVLYCYSLCVKVLFIVLNMVVILKDLIELELFGYEKGVFIGVNIICQGCFEQVDGGILFFDEIGDMLLDVQMCLLCVLVDGQFYCVGGYVLVKVDVWIIVVIYQNFEQ